MNREQGAELVTIARERVESGLEGRTAPEREGDWLREPGATFVTLTMLGDLRGCIGSLEATRPLIEDVRANAWAAAMRDPRFSPVRIEELAEIVFEVSLLSPNEQIRVTDEAELLDRLRPGIDGLVIRDGARGATFLPQVWETLPRPEEFLAHLKQKAGLGRDHWSESFEVYRYTVEKFSESDLRD